VVILSSVATFGRAAEWRRLTGMLVYWCCGLIGQYAAVAARDCILIALQSVDYGRMRAVRPGQCQDWAGFVVTSSVPRVGSSRILERERQVRLNKTENRYRAFVERLPIGVYRTSLAADGEFIMANPAFLQMFGFESEADLKKTRPRDLFVDPNERDRFVKRLMAEGQANGVELHLKRKDGMPIWGMVTGRLMRDEDTGAPYCDCSIQDVTGRKLAEAAFEEGEQRYRNSV
jgi:PAS domain S-box-containing protein